MRNVHVNGAKKVLYCISRYQPPTFAIDSARFRPPRQMTRKSLARSMRRVEVFEGKSPYLCMTSPPAHRMQYLANHATAEVVLVVMSTGEAAGKACDDYRCRP